MSNYISCELWDGCMTVLELREKNTKLKELLKILEWVDTNGFGKRCPICENEKSEGHTKDCELSKLLEETK